MDEFSETYESDRWEFALKDLARRKLQTILTITGLTICVSVPIFLLLLGESLSIEVTSFIEGGLSVGFKGVFSRFLLLAVLLNFFIGFLVAYFLINVTTSKRARDVAIMKAVGCLTDVVYIYFSTQLIFIVLASCVVGILSGIFLNIISIGVLNLQGFPITMIPYDPLLLFIIFIFFAFAFYIIGIRRIAKVVKVKSISALSPLFILGTRNRSFFEPLFSLLKGYIPRIALRDLGRRRSITIQSFICLSSVMILMTLVVVGSVVADETMQSYVERAIGTNVYVVAKQPMVEQYIRLHSRFLGYNQPQNIDYLDNNHYIPDSVISQIENINGVKIDPRIIVDAIAYEQLHISVDDLDNYIVVGDHRNVECLVIGINPEDLVSDWVILGDLPSNEKPNAVLMGDSAAITLFSDPWIQTFKMFGFEWSINGLCFDPLNNGLVIYMPVNKLSAIVEYSGYNILLLEIDPSNYSSILGEVEEAVSNHDLIITSLDNIVDDQKGLVKNHWFMLRMFSLISFASAIVSLVCYSIVSISSQRRDFVIMRALGAKQSFIWRILVLRTFFLIMAAGLVGIPIGLIFVFNFFISDPAVSLEAIITVIILFVVLLTVLGISSLASTLIVNKSSTQKVLKTI